MAESSKSLTLTLSGGLGAVAGFIPGELVQAIGPEATSVGGLLLNTGAWTAVVAAGYTAALVIGQNK